MQLTGPTNITPEPVAPLSEKGLSHMLATYRLQAIRGRNYAFGFDWREDSAEPMAQQPRSARISRYPVGAACKWVSPISPRGKKKPLRAIGWRQMSRQYWSKGRVLNEDALERAQARDLTLHERDVNTLSIEELEATQHLEPLSESRRSYLTRGVGVLTLDKAAYDEGSIGEMLADDISDLHLEIDPTEGPGEPDWNAAALHNNFGSRVAYEDVDPITAKQIAWEQEQWGNSEVEILHPAVRPYTGPKMPEKQALALGRKFDAFVRNEVDRMMSLDDAIMHGSYEYEEFDKDGNPVTLIALHSPRGLSVDDQKNGPWHGTIQDRSEVGIGYMDSPEDWEADAGSRPCEECGAGTLPAHSPIQSGSYAGMLFCSNDDCNNSEFDEYHFLQFDPLVQRLEAGA